MAECMRPFITAVVLAQHHPWALRPGARSETEDDTADACCPADHLADRADDSQSTRWFDNLWKYVGCSRVFQFELRHTRVDGDVLAGGISIPQSRSKCRSDTFASLGEVCAVVISLPALATFLRVSVLRAQRLCASFSPSYRHQRSHDLLHTSLGCQ
jgi:hypothetical protein